MNKDTTIEFEALLDGFRRGDPLLVGSYSAQEISEWMQTCPNFPYFCQVMVSCGKEAYRISQKRLPQTPPWEKGDRTEPLTWEKDKQEWQV